MTGSTASQRTAIAVSFVAQAVLIAAALAGAQSASQGHQAFATSSSASASPLIVPMNVHTPVTIDIAGGSYTVSFPAISPTPTAEVSGNGDWTVNVTVQNLAPSMSDLWFAIAGPRASGPAQVVSKVSDLPPGTDKFMFIVPAADVPAGGAATIIMGATENGQQVKSSVLDIVTKGGRSAN